MQTKLRTFSALVTAMVFLFSGSCRKALPDVSDYFPDVRTVSATVQTDGTVLVEGEIVSEGDAPVEYTGFCCGTMNEPQLLNRQLISTSVSGTHFTAVYSGFSIDSTYYFRSWATNDYGYVYGDIIVLDSIVATPVVAPCSLPMNSVNTGGSTPTYTYYDVTQPTQYMGIWEFDAESSSGPSVHFEFGSGLTTGIYTTTINTSPGSGEVYVSFINGFTSGALNSGSNVYVNTIGPGTYEVTICNAPWTYNSSTFYFRTRLTVPL